MAGRTVFSGGRIVTPAGVIRGDLVVENGRIASISQERISGERVDVDDLLVLPGMVDTHVHLMDPGPTEREDFPTGTRAAAARGATTIVEHTHMRPVKSAGDLSEKRSHLRDRSNVDYALAAHVWPDMVPTLGDLWQAGVTFFKVFTCTTHGVPGLDAAELLATFRAIADFDGRVLIHCEDESITREAERLLRDQGRDDPQILTVWRNREAELVAVAAISVLAEATGLTATVAHVSTPDVADVIASARRRGADIAAEACPQYFALDEDEVNVHGPLRKFTPPARIRSESERKDMWKAVRNGGFSHFSTDHAPSTLAQKLTGIWDAPFGLPGLDTTYPFLIDAALRGEISLPELARLAAAAPADRYLLAPRKGRLAQGADADLVIVDPAASWTVEDGDILSKAGWSPYSGRTFRGRIVATYLRGTEISRNGTPHDQRSGEFLPGPGNR